MSHIEIQDMEMDIGVCISICVKEEDVDFLHEAHLGQYPGWQVSQEEPPQKP